LLQCLFLSMNYGILYYYFLLFFFFFFQAEDGIRDGHVTGVQTCALPIYLTTLPSASSFNTRRRGESRSSSSEEVGRADLETCARSEERRVGKECRSRWAPDY